MELFTTTLGRWRLLKDRNIEMIDTTVKSGEPAFAPSRNTPHPLLTEWVWHAMSFFFVRFAGIKEFPGDEAPGNPPLNQHPVD